jgi:hypothetical protein
MYMNHRFTKKKKKINQSKNKIKKKQLKNKIKFKKTLKKRRIGGNDQKMYISIKPNSLDIGKEMITSMKITGHKMNIDERLNEIVKSNYKITDAPIYEKIISVDTSRKTTNKNLFPK